MSGLDAIDHLVILMLENRSFDQMLGMTYQGSATVSGLRGTEQNKDAGGNNLAVFPITTDMENCDFYPLANPDEGYEATNRQLFSTTEAPVPPNATNTGFVTSFEGWLKSSPY